MEVGTGKRVLIVNLIPPSAGREEIERDATELYNLVVSLGEYTVVDMVHQRGYPAKDAFIGLGKAAEIAEIIQTLDIDVVVLSGAAKPRQVYALWQVFQPAKATIEVWDRIDLILRIFSRHAKTAEAKLQIEIAQMRHMGPKIYGMGHVLSRQGGTTGTRGLGETNVELMKRHWKEAMRQKREHLAKLSGIRRTQISKRKELGMPTLSIIGYTNAGKTSLYNRLTKKGNLAKNVLFATLDSTVGKLYLPSLRKEVFVSDTIGFIKNLPPALIDAFRSTLLESVYADCLLHVIDVSDPSVPEQFNIVEDILVDLGITQKDRLLVFNKIDVIEEDTLLRLLARYGRFNPICISVQTGEGIPKLIEAIGHMVSKDAPSTLSTHGRVEKVLPLRNDVRPGMQVSIVEKQNQDSGVRTEGTVVRVLTHGYNHPHGIKVELSDGRIGRVKEILR